MAGPTGEQDWYVSGVFSMAFINLNDTFGDYLDRAGLVPKVNSEENALIPSDTKIDSHRDRHKQGGADEIDVSELSGGLGTAGQVPKTDGAAVTWVNLSHGILSGIGYNDHHGVGTGIKWDANNDIAHGPASVHESGGALEITHNNLDISYNDHHGVGTGIKWDAGNDIAHEVASIHESGGALEITHNNLQIGASDHHSRYTDSEAISALENNSNVFTRTQDIQLTPDNNFCLLRNTNTGDFINFRILSDTEFRIYGHDESSGVSSKFVYYYPASQKWVLDPDTEIPKECLKTSIGSVCQGSTGSRSHTLPGGQYGFYPQIKDTEYNGNDGAAYIYDHTGVFSYKTTISLGAGVSNYDICVRQRYLTSSGPIHWVFMRRDKATGKVTAVWQAPDHPCYGNGGDPEKLPHPFLDLSENEEVLVINPSEEQVKEINKQTLDKDGMDTGNTDFIDVLKRDYDTHDHHGRPDFEDIDVSVGLTSEFSDNPRQSVHKKIKVSPGLIPARIQRK